MRLRLALAVLVAAVALPSLASARIALRESGSTLLFPVMNLWVAAYARVAPEVDVTTEASGSGNGIALAQDGTVQIGATDAYLSDALEARGEIVQIPLAISGQFVACNLPGVATLRLNAEILAAIYDGRLTAWNDPRIAAINPGTQLPAAPIVPLLRSDRSGDSFLFTSYLSAEAPQAWSVAPSTAPAWPPLARAQRAKGNRQLLDLLHNTPGGIAYIGISLLSQAEVLGVGVASLRNRDGAYVVPSIDGIAAAAARIGSVPRDGRLSLIALPGATTYPIANVEYAVVRKTQADGTTAQAVRALLEWIVDPSGGNAREFLDPVHFVPLPEPVRALSRAEIAALR